MIRQIKYGLRSPVCLSSCPQPPAGGSKYAAAGLDGTVKRETITYASTSRLPKCDRSHSCPVFPSCPVRGPSGGGMALVRPCDPMLYRCSSVQLLFVIGDRYFEIVSLPYRLEQGHPGHEPGAGQCRPPEIAISGPPTYCRRKRSRRRELQCRGLDVEQRGADFHWPTRRVGARGRWPTQSLRRQTTRHSGYC